MRSISQIMTQFCYFIGANVILPAERERKREREQRQAETYESGSAQAHPAF